MMISKPLMAAITFSVVIAVTLAFFILKSIVNSANEIDTILERSEHSYYLSCGQIGSDYTKEKPQVINGMYEYVSLDNYHYTVAVDRCKLRSPLLVPSKTK